MNAGKNMTKTAIFYQIRPKSKTTPGKIEALDTGNIKQLDRKNLQLKKRKRHNHSSFLAASPNDSLNGNQVFDAKLILNQPLVPNLNPSLRH